MKVLNQRILTIASFTFFNAWMLSFAYEGQILYALFARYEIDGIAFCLGAILCLAAGLFACGYLVRSLSVARKGMLLSAGVCAVGSLVFFFPPSGLWTAALWISAFFMGLWIASWGWFYRSCSAPRQRMSTAAASIALSTTLMIGLNLVAIHWLPQIGLGLAVLCLAASLFLTAGLPKAETGAAGNTVAPAEPESRVSIRVPLALLCLFILIITVNSGLMFQTVNPAFAHLTALTSWYWAVPYIAAVVIVALLPKKINRGYILYAAIALMGLGFLAFLVLDRSAGSYLAVNTLLLGAFGINDLFWWSILGEMLDHHKNPAKVMGLGLSVNVAGVLLGELLCGLISKQNTSLVGLTVVCVALVILPPLHKQLCVLLKNSSFLATIEAMPPEKQQATIEGFLHAFELTEREREITSLLLKGYTHHMIANELFISESTVKTHIQNIYYKYDVHNKTDLIYKLTK